MEDTLWTEAMITQVVRVGMTQAVEEDIVEEEDVIQVVEADIVEEVEKHAEVVEDSLEELLFHPTERSGKRVSRVVDPEDLSTVADEEDEDLT